ncbi:hypothetical protein J2X78_003166 [Pedobacter africanus]|uniref:Uncharacterized protein n=1 Tax=Pedobacter africanus TaxID=151894 RepID=A0ACC6KZJ8_9SPHI|nr:hypothetical protein [Pedobacter africanus]
MILVTPETIQNKIYTIRGKQVMMDRDLAVLYGVETKVLNQAVKRNIKKFPADFRFELTKIEHDFLRSQFVTLEKKNSKGTHSKYLGAVFTESGIGMLASVLRSETAVGVCVQIMRAFVEMRKFLRDNAEVFVRLDNVERKLLKADENFERIFNALQSPDVKPRQGIFYDGQVFDAYTFVADLIREAKQSIVLIDNYVDDTVLKLFVKRLKGVSCTIYTQKISPQLALDLQKHNAQYDIVAIKEFKQAHDRFLILDETIVYHIGASLKDLGKKWFAFSNIGLNAAEMLGKLV